MFILTATQSTLQPSSIGNVEDSEALSLKLESYFSDLDRVRNSIDALNSGFKDTTTLVFVEQNLSTLQNNYGSFIRSESHLDVHSRLKYRAENIFKTIWEKIIAFWEWIVNKVKSLFGFNSDKKEEAQETCKEIEKSVKEVKHQNMSVTPEVVNVVNTKLKKVKDLPKEQANEVAKSLDDVAKGKKDAEVEVATSIDNLVKDFREKIDAKGKAEAKAEAVKLKEKEEKAKIEKGLNINLKDKLFKLDNILSGSSFPIPDRRSLMELNNDQITVLEIFKELKRLIGTSKKLEKATPEMIFKSFFEAFSNKGAEINFKDFNESKDESIICFLGNKKHLVVTVKEGGLKAQIRNYKEKVSTQPIVVADIFNISKSLSIIVSDGRENVEYFLKISEEIKNEIKTCVESENKNLQNIIKQISSAASVIPLIVSHTTSLNKQIVESLKEIEKFTTIVKEAGL